MNQFLLPYLHAMDESKRQQHLDECEIAGVVGTGVPDSLNEPLSCDFTPGSVVSFIFKGVLVPES
jgi:hypothetical protein